MWTEVSVYDDPDCFLNVFYRGRYQATALDTENDVITVISSFHNKSIELVIDMTSSVLFEIMGCLSINIPNTGITYRSDTYLSINYDIIKYLQYHTDILNDISSILETYCDIADDTKVRISNIITYALDKCRPACR
jgi:hypothetical protein